MEDDKNKNDQSDDSVDGENQDDKSNAGDDSNQKSSENKFEKRFSHLKGDSAEEYVKSLEEAYTNSSREARKLAEANKSTNEDDSKDKDESKDNKSKDESKDSKQSVDPILAELVNERKAEKTGQMDNFIENHSELMGSPSLQKEFVDTVGQLEQAGLALGKRPSVQELLMQSWKFMGRDVSDKHSEAVNQMKESTASSNAQASKKANIEKNDLSGEQRKQMSRWGISDSDVKKARELAKKNKINA